jgi:hypothetical protein
MAESSTRIANADSGNYIATRDANAPDASANAREVTLVDQSTRIWGVTYASPTRTVTAADPADLGTDFASVPAGLISAKLTVGDHNLLTVSAHVGNPNSVSLASIEPLAVVPLILDASNNVLGYLTPKTVLPWAPDSTYTPMQYTDTSVSHYIAPLLSWPLNGAGPYIGIGLLGTMGYGKSGTDNLSVKLYADLVSGPEGGGSIDRAISSFAGQYGYSTAP